MPLRISEEIERLEHVPTDRELKEQQRHPWVRVPSHDLVASGRLRIDVGGPARTERKSFWADRTLWSLEDKLPELLREVAVRADEFRLRREAKVQAETEYHQAVEREQERARLRAAETHRTKILENQLVRWREVRELREFATALTERIATAEKEDEVENEAIAEAHQWLEWIKERADRNDPIKRLSAWPKPPQLRSYELDKFMSRVPKPVEMQYQPESY